MFLNPVTTSILTPPLYNSKHNMLSLLGCAESVLANSNQTYLSIHEILDGILDSDFNKHTLSNAYTALASALFTEIQRPGSKFERNGNKFTLKKDNQAPTNQLADISLCNRRRRRNTSNSNSSSSSASSSPRLPIEPISIPKVQLSTTTNPPGRTRTSSILHPLPSQDIPLKRNITEPLKKRVQFALERNEVFLIERSEETPELTLFPTLTESQP